MRRLQDFQDQSRAHALVDHLETQGIEALVRDRADGFAVWVALDAHMTRAQELAEGFEPGRTVDPIQLGTAAETARRIREKDSRPVYTPTIRTRSFSAPTWGPGIVGLIAISVVVALLTELGSEPSPSLYIAPVDSAAQHFLPLDWQEPWRLITPIFMHFGFLHIVFNMMWLHELGGQLESRHGTVRMLAVVAVGAVLSNLGQYYLSGPNFGGMSGVNYTLFAFVWMQARYAPDSGYGLPASTTWWLMGWLVLCGTGMMGAVANAAHAVGLVVGLALGLPAYGQFRRKYRVSARFEKGSWEDLHVKGWQRFERLVLEPYLPGWFLLVAVAVALR